MLYRDARQSVFQLSSIFQLLVNKYFLLGMLAQVSSNLKVGIDARAKEGYIIYLFRFFLMKLSFINSFGYSRFYNLFLIPVFLFSSVFNSYSQTSSGNWVLSGNASFNSLRNVSAGTLQFKQTDFLVSASVGYFVADKFVLGAKPSFSYVTNSINFNGEKETLFSIGPFARYYLLNAYRHFNIFTEVGYAYGKNTRINLGQNTFYFLAGPVLYFNTSVGLEFTAGYSLTKVSGYDGINRAIRMGLGFQFYLERE